MIVGVIPPRILRWFGLEWEPAYHLNILVSSMALLGVLFLAPAGGLPGKCLILLLTDEACPFCGVTRSAIAFLHGDPRRAWALHPMGIALALTFALQIPWRGLLLVGTVRREIQSHLRSQRVWNGVIIGSCAVVVALRSLGRG